MKLISISLLLGLLVLVACTKVDSETELPDDDMSIEQLSVHVPSFQIEVDAAQFVDMTTRFEEDIEIPAYISQWRSGELIAERLKAEIQVKGNYSANYPAKPLGVKLDKTYANEKRDFFDVPALKSGHSLDQIKSFRLRNGGNDFDNTLLKDFAYSRMVAASDMDVLVYYGEPAAAFVNDEFYGLFNLRSEGNANGVSRLVGVKKRDLLLAELDEEQVFEVKQGDSLFFRNLEHAINSKDLAYLEEAVDEKSFIDFILVGTMFAVWDWPWKNVRVYAPKGGKIKFMSYDFDLASDLHVDKGPLVHIQDRQDNPITRMFNVFYEDENFRASFWERYHEVLDGGMLSPQRFKEELVVLSEAFDPVIMYQTQRYGFPASRGDWYLRIEKLIEDYELRYRQLIQER